MASHLTGQPRRNIKVSPHTSQRKWRFLLGVAPGIIVVSGCKPAPATSSIFTAKEAEIVRLPDAGPRTEASEPQPAIVPPASQGPRPAEAADLERRFFASAELEERAAVIEELWTLNTPSALTTIHRLFHADRNPDLKIEALSGLLDAETTITTRELRWGLLLAGLGRSEPASVREVAATILSETSDPRASTVLQSLANDPDEGVREVIESALMERRAARGEVD